MTSADAAALAGTSTLSVLAYCVVWPLSDVSVKVTLTERIRGDCGAATTVAAAVAVAVAVGCAVAVALGRGVAEAAAALA
jgi:hypothetical protein